MSLLCRSSIGSLLEVPQIQFIAGVCGPSSMHRDKGLSAWLGGDVGLGSFRAPPGRPGVERQFWDCQFILRCCRHGHLVERTYKNHHNNHNNLASIPSVPNSCVFVLVTMDLSWKPVTGAALRRRGRRLRAAWRHEQQSIAWAVTTFTHHSSIRPGPGSGRAS